MKTRYELNQFSACLKMLNNLYILEVTIFCAKETKFCGLAHFHGKKQILWLGLKFRDPWKTVIPTPYSSFVS